ncbi:hypothetical protein B9T10_07315 [Wohlfahrtiimonas chitiniclastica]|nr:hypothetical protein B9T10_07315 [Wohlfahrtiimonas chitiniclastica]
MASEKQQEKWVKEGRGSGEGSLYKPWITVRDIPSSGRSHRVYGYKSRRTHHSFMGHLRSYGSCGNCTRENSIKWAQ